MADLIYTAIMSTDGFIADARGEFDWAMPDETVHFFINSLERPVGTYLYDRRLYEVMAVWENDAMIEGQPEYVKEYAAIWRAAEKIVFSKTLHTVQSSRTRIKRELDPADIRAMKADKTRAIGIGGADLAGQALAAGLVDEIRLVIAPVLVGSGKQALPAGGRLDLRLVEDRVFSNGMLYLRYCIVKKKPDKQAPA